MVSNQAEPMADCQDAISIMVFGSQNQTSAGVADSRAAALCDNVATLQSHSVGPNRKWSSHACDHQSCNAQTANMKTRIDVRFIQSASPSNIVSTRTPNIVCVR